MNILLLIAYFIISYGVILFVASNSHHSSDNDWRLQVGIILFFWPLIFIGIVLVKIYYDLIRWSRNG